MFGTILIFYLVEWKEDRPHMERSGVKKYKFIKCLYETQQDVLTHQIEGFPDVSYFAYPSGKEPMENV